MFGISNPFGGGGGGDDDSGSSSSSSSSSNDSSTDDGGGGGGFFGGISDAVDDAADTVSDTVDDVTGGSSSGGSSSGGSSSGSSSSGGGYSYGGYTGGGYDYGGGSSSGGSSRGSSSGSSSSSGGSSRSSSTRSSSGSSSSGSGGGGGLLGGLGDVADDAMQGIEDTTDAAQDAADDVSRDVNRTVDRAQESANEVSRDIDRTVDRTVNDASRTARDVGNEARDAAERAVDEADRAVDEAARSGSRAAEDAARRAREASRDAAAAADRMAGQTDEATARAVDSARRGDVAGVGDAAAGSFDESVGRNVEAYDAGADVLAGSTDEAVGRAVQSASEGDLAGVGDALAGDTDEATARAVESARQGDLGGVGDAAAGGLDEATSGVVGNADQFADAAAGSTDEAVGRAVSDAQSGDWAGAGDNLAGGLDEGLGQAGQNVARATDMAASGDFAGAGDFLAGNADETFSQQADDAVQTYTQMGQQIGQGDFGGAFNTYVEGAERGADRLAGSTDEWVGGAFDKSAADAVTGSGGFLTESQEADLASAASEFSSDVKATANLAGGAVDYVDPGQGQGWAGDATRGAVGGVLGLGNVFAGAGAAETGAETAANLDEGNAAGVAASSAALGGAALGGMYDSAKNNPARFAGSFAGEALLGAGVGKVAGSASRLAKGRVRTFGGTKIDADGNLAGSDVVRYTETDGAEGTQFPPARDPDGYQSDPATAVQDQAEEFTPQEVSGFFDEQGVTEGSVLKKALDVEPDGPQTGRSDTGFTSAPDEVDGNFQYETPGSFFGPELSPNFLRVGGGESSFSLRPGLPDFGNNPTGVLARTDVENSKADTLEGFNEEIMDRTGDSTAVTKPASEVNKGEVEAVVPPGAEFAPVRSGGPITAAARRLGIGSDFYTEVGGRRVPLRTVAPEGKIDASDGSSTDGALPGDTSGSGRSLDSYVEAPGQAVDRPIPPGLPGAGAGAGAQSAAGAGAGSQPSYDGPATYENPYNGGSLFSESSAQHIFDTGGPGFDRPSDTPGRTSSPDDSSPPSSRPPSSGSPSDGLGPEWSPGGFLDESGGTSSPSSPGDGGGPDYTAPSPGFDEYGPTSPPSSPPSSGSPGSGGPSSPPSSGPPSSGGPSSPPGSPPPWSPPGSYGGGGSSSTSRPPGSPGGPGSGGFGSSPFDPTNQRRRYDDEDRKRKDEEEFLRPDYGVTYTPFENPIASGAQVLFGGLGAGFGNSMDASEGDLGFGDGALDESGGLQDAGFGDEMSQGGPIDEAGGLDDWTPF